MRVVEINRDHGIVRNAGRGAEDDGRRSRNFRRESDLVSECETELEDVGEFDPEFGNWR